MLGDTRVIHFKKNHVNRKEGNWKGNQVRVSRKANTGRSKLIYWKVRTESDLCSPSASTRRADMGRNRRCQVNNPHSNCHKELATCTKLGAKGVRGAERRCYWIKHQFKFRRYRLYSHSPMPIKLCEHIVPFPLFKVPTCKIEHNYYQSNCTIIMIAWLWSSMQWCSWISARKKKKS